MVVFYIYIFFLLLFHDGGLSLRRGYEAERHIKAFELISFVPILHADCPTGMVTYTVTHLMI